MEALQSTNLVRKQLMLSNDNIQKLERIAKEKDLSVANVVRFAIDSFDPNKTVDDNEDSELIQLVSERLKETIIETEKVGKRLDNALAKIEARSR
jgi:hypothetical protein